MPHRGSYIEAETVRNAYELNVPMTAVITESKSGKLPASDSFFSVDAENVIIEVVKKAEKENAVILRLYDAHNQRGPVMLTTSLPVKSAVETDLLENEVGPLTMGDGMVTFDIATFEIKTIKLEI
jgi:alpha-mannosidase